MNTFKTKYLNVLTNVLISIFIFSIIIYIKATNHIHYKYHNKNL